MIEEFENLLETLNKLVDREATIIIKKKKEGIEIKGVGHPADIQYMLISALASSITQNFETKKQTEEILNLIMEGLKGMVENNE